MTPIRRWSATRFGRAIPTSAWRLLAGAVVPTLCAWLVTAPAMAQTSPAGPALAADASPAAADRSADRGSGVPTSMFGTYVRGGELLVYPFFEHYRANRFEYKPSEFGLPGEIDQRGRFRAREVLFFAAYGITDDLAVEVEGAAIRASLEKAPTDVSALPAKISEAGLGDVEGQIRWRWHRETEERPELFSFAEMVVPHHRDRPLTGTAGLELKFGTGVTRGFSWGTITARAALEYAAGSSSRFDTGEYAVEYLKRLSPRWRVYLGVEGKQDEASAIVEAQWHVAPNAFVRLNTGRGLTSKAPDWAPEVGVVISLRRR